MLVRSATWWGGEANTLLFPTDPAPPATPGAGGNASARWTRRPPRYYSSHRSLCKGGAEPRLASHPAPLVSAGGFNPRQFVKFPTDVGQTQHHSHLINQEEIRAARSSGKCSFQDDFWETEEGSELSQPTGAGIRHGSGVGLAFACAAVIRSCKLWAVAAATV